MVEHEKDAFSLLRCTARLQKAVIKQAIRCSVEQFHAYAHARTASQECSHFPSKQCDTFSLYGRRLAHTGSNVRMPYFAVTLTNYTEECQIADGKTLLLRVKELEI